jgi:pimeloyl-ACP methyl ester carboxylesterase
VDTLDFLIEHGHDRDKLRDAFDKMFERPPGQVLDLTLDAVELVDIEVHRAQKEQDPHFSIEDDLKDVPAPVLLVSGRRDRVVPPAKQYDMACRLQRSKQVIFSAEGHMLAIESAAMAAREVLAFLDPAEQVTVNGMAGRQS